QQFGDYPAGRAQLFLPLALAVVDQQLQLVVAAGDQGLDFLVEALFVLEIEDHGVEANNGVETHIRQLFLPAGQLVAAVANKIEHRNHRLPRHGDNGEFVDIFAQHRLPAVNDIEDQIVPQQLANHLGLLVEGGVVGELLENPLQPGPAGGGLYLQDGGQQADGVLQARGVVDGDNGLVVRQNGAAL